MPVRSKPLQIVRKSVNQSIMAKLVDYGILDYEDIADYKIPVETIDTMLGLLAFPIIEETINDDGITINVYEKSFWGKKHRGYISLKHIDDIQADITKFNYDDGSVAPENSEILIGLDFSCVYTEIYVRAHVKTYALGRPRKQILSYGVVIDNLNSKDQLWRKLSMEQLEESMSAFPPMAINQLPGIMIDSFTELRKKFKVFEKYITVQQK